MAKFFGLKSLLTLISFHNKSLNQIVLFKHTYFVGKSISKIN